MIVVRGNSRGLRKYAGSAVVEQRKRSHHLALLRWGWNVEEDGERFTKHFGTGRVSYITNKLFEGSVQEKIGQLIALPAGREMVLYLCLAEIALPFFDNVVAGGWDFASRHLQGAMAEGESRFGQVMGEKATGELKETLEGMNKLLGQTMTSVHGHLGPVVSKLDSAMPKIFNITDSATGVMATALDALPVWRFLGGRLAAEASALRTVGAATPEVAGGSALEVSS
jgi:hypothetical protein